MSVAAAEKPVLTYSHTAHVSHGTRRPKGPPVVRPHWQSDALIVSIRDLSSHCSPAPKLSAEASEGVLKLTVMPPTGPVARCSGAHDLTIRVDDAPKELTKVVLIDRKGEERSSALVSSP